MSIQPINAIQFGQLGKTQAINRTNPAPAVNQFAAQNFQTNHNKGELVPQVQNQVLANKINYFA